MRSLDLFSGYGGITLALQNYVKPIAYVEIEEYAQKIIGYRMADGSLPRATILGDVKNVRGSVGVCDIITGGFPCQDISVAGNGKGLAGQRSGLFYEVIRLTKEIRPTFVFLENVPAIRTRGLEQVIKAFTEVGYDCRWTCLSAASVGANHKRERWFLLAYSTTSGLQEWRQAGFNQSTEKATTGVEQQSQRHGALADSSSKISSRLSSREGEKHSELRSTSKHIFESSWWAVEPKLGRIIDGDFTELDEISTIEKRIIFYAKDKGIEYSQVLRTLCENIDEKKIRSEVGRFKCIQETPLLFYFLLGIKKRWADEAWIQLASEKALKDYMFGLWEQKKFASPSHRSEKRKQSAGEHTNSMQKLSQLLALDAETSWIDCRWKDAPTILNYWGEQFEYGIKRTILNEDFRVERIKALGNGVVPLQVKTAFELLMGLV